jgi:acyl-CoA dehydrogenase
MFPRSIYTDEHEPLRDTARKFFEREVAPDHAKWEEAGIVPRSVWRKAGEAGLLCTSMPEEYGGLGLDKSYAAMLMEEQAKLGFTGPGFGLHSEIVAPYILAYGTEDQKKTWLPKMASGEAVGAIAMTEPGAGSDLQGIRTTAVRDGNDYVINGQKTFITNGQNADIVVLVTKTDPKAGAKGTSLILVEGDRKGFTKGRNLEKVGMKAQDTSELFFADVRVPVGNRLGGEGQGFVLLMQELPWERLQIAIMAIAACQGALQWTIDYVKERKAFGKAIIDFQTVRHELADIKTQVQVAQVFVDRCIDLLCEKKLDATDAAMAKYWTTDLQGRLLDRCLQLFGGYGFMWEYPITRAWADARVQRIYGGTNEIMKEIVGRSL